MEKTHKIKKALPYIPTGIWIIFLGIFAVQVISEAYFKIPVMILPYPGQSLKNGTGDFYWNYVVGVSKKKQLFRLEIASNSDFKKIVKTKLSPINHVRINNVFKGKGPYYFRLRMEADGKVFSWSRPIKVYGQNG